MFSVGKITKYWLLLFKIEVKKIILFVPMTLNFCKDFGSEDKLYCGTYCYNSCNTFSRSESGAETRSQTFQFLRYIEPEPSC
jgi:hypothetical protein